METVSFHDATQLFLTGLQAEGATDNTIKDYDTVLKQFVRFLQEQGCQTVQDVTPAHIRQWIIHKREQGVSSHTLFNAYRLPRRWFNWLLQEGVLDSNPFAKVPKPKLEQVVKRALTDDEIRRLLRTQNSKHWLTLRDRALVTLLLSTGLRAMEAHQLKVKDANGDALLIKGKGGKQRIVPLTPQARLAIKRYLVACPHRPQPDDPLWWGNSGALTLDGLKQAVRDLGARAGIQCGAHQLRRTFATRLLQSGASMEHVRLLMGHSDYTVLRQYLHLSGDDLRETIKQHNPLRNIKETRR